MIRKKPKKPQTIINVNVEKYIYINQDYQDIKKHVILKMKIIK